MSPGSCCQIVASMFSILSYHTGISGFRKAGELGFEPRQADPESAVLPLHHSPKDFFKLGGLENSVKIKGALPIGVHRGGSRVPKNAGSTCSPAFLQMRLLDDFSPAGKKHGSFRPTSASIE